MPLMPAHSSSTNDHCQVRIRGKNNLFETRTGSVTRTLDELSEADSRRRELLKASERLKQLEKLERYREERLHREIQIYEEQRQREEHEVGRMRDREAQRARYFERQKEQLGGLRAKRNQEDQEKGKEAEERRRQERMLKRKREVEMEQQKKRIQEYKNKKRQTEHLLANAEYIDYEDIANQTPDLDDYEPIGGGQDILDTMARQNVLSAKDSNLPANIDGVPRKRPPAIQ